MTTLPNDLLEEISKQESVDMEFSKPSRYPVEEILGYIEDDNLKKVLWLMNAKAKEVLTLKEPKEKLTSDQNRIQKLESDLGILNRFLFESLTTIYPEIMAKRGDKEITIGQDFEINLMSKCYLCREYKNESELGGGKLECLQDSSKCLKEAADFLSKFVHHF